MSLVPSGVEIQGGLGLFPVESHPRESGPTSPGRSIKLPGKARTRRSHHNVRNRNRTDRSGRSPRSNNKPPPSAATLLPKGRRASAAGPEKESRRCSASRIFIHAHPDVARRLEPLLAQDGFGIGQQAIPEAVVGPGPGNDPAPLFVLNPLLLSHDAPLSSVPRLRISKRNLSRLPWPRYHNRKPQSTTYRQKVKEAIPIRSKAKLPLKFVIPELPLHWRGGSDA